MKGMDATTRRVLDALVRDPRADTTSLAAAAGVEPDVASNRLARLKDMGVLTGFSVRLDGEKLGCPLEVWATGVPTAATGLDDLEWLAQQPGITRVFTLAEHRSVAFTLWGADMEELEHEARRLGDAMGLQDVQSTLILSTVHDDPGRAVTGERTVTA